MGIIGAVVAQFHRASFSSYSGRGGGDHSISSTVFREQEGIIGNRRPFSDAQNNSRLFFSTLFSMLGKLSVADGRISDEEKQTIYHFMRQDLRLDPVSQQAAMEIFNAAARSGDLFESLCPSVLSGFCRKCPVYGASA